MNLHDNVIPKIFFLQRLEGAGDNFLKNDTEFILTKS